MPAKIKQRIQNLEPGIRVELIEADLTPLGGTVLRFHPSLTQGTSAIVWQGNSYTAFPCQIEGIEYKTQGTLPRPHLKFSNIGSIITSYLRLYQDCIGAKVTRHVTFFEFLDGQPGADPTQEFPLDIFFIEQKVAETNIEVEFELVSALDIQGLQLPLRQLQPGTCSWIYRSGEGCDYNGPPVADKDDNTLTIAAGAAPYNSGTTYAINQFVTFGGGWWRSLQNSNLNHTPTFGSAFWFAEGQPWDNTVTYRTGDFVYVLVGGVRQYYVSIANSNTAPLSDATKWTRDWCSKTLGACKVRFGATNPLPFGAFPGVTRLPHV